MTTEARERHAVISHEVRLEPVSSTFVTVRARYAITSDAITLPESVTHRTLSVPSALCKLSPTLRGKYHQVTCRSRPRHSSFPHFSFTAETFRSLQAHQQQSVVLHLSRYHDSQTFSLTCTDYPEAQDAIMDVLTRHRDVLALPGELLGKTNIVQHKLHLVDNAKPVYIRAYRLPHSKRALAENIVSFMLQEGIIEHSVIITSQHPPSVMTREILCVP